MNFPEDKTSNDFVDWHCMPVTACCLIASLLLCSGCSFKMNTSNNSAYFKADTVLVCVYCASNIYAVSACACVYISEQKRAI